MLSFMLNKLKMSITINMLMDALVIDHEGSDKYDEVLGV